MGFESYFSSIENIIARGGPVPSEYSYVIDVPDMSDISLVDEARMHKILSPILDVNSLLGYTFHKPKGYAGDYELIDRIYTKWISKDPQHHRWDSLYHHLDPSKAVRNRKKYFIREISKLNQKEHGARVLNLGSGPCSDLHEYLNQTANNSLYFDCLDMDSNAIDYAEGVCDNYYESISFIKKNAFRYKPDTRYNLIWSAGLFDYFSDKLFTRLLNRMYALLADNGEIIVGNFSPNNPSRGLMEAFGQWYLHHRSESELIALAISAGISSDKIEVKSEELGVNLFLHARK